MGNFSSKITLHRFIYPALLGFAGILHAAGTTAVFDARDFGATGDGTTLETVALNRAVEACAKAGGGVGGAAL